jgi:hypothetical protein
MPSARESSPHSFDRRGLALVLALAAIAAFLATLLPSDDPDMFHHLAVGREVVRGGSAAIRPLLFPSDGAPPIAMPYWLGSAAIYGAWAAFGDAGLSLLPALVGALLAVVLVLDAAPRRRPHGWTSLAAAAAPVALALATYRYRAVARTEIFSVAMLALTMWALRRHDEGKSRLLLALPVVAVLWTNLHPGTAVGMVAIGLYVAAGAAERLGRAALRWDAGEAPSWRALGVAAAVLVGVGLASGVTPAAGNPILLAARFVASALGLTPSGAVEAPIANAVALVEEMHGGGVELLSTPVGALLALSAVGFALRGRAVRPAELATVAAFAVLPFHAVRFAMFFAIVAAPIAARNLGAALTSWGAGLTASARTTATAAVAALALAALPLGRLAPHLRLGVGIQHRAFPERGAEALRALGFSGRLYDAVHFGGFLQWNGFTPFQDGSLSASPTDAAGAIAGPTHWALFAPLDARYRFDALLIAYPAGDPNTGAAFGVYDPPPSTWALVAFDDAGLLYLRRDGKYAAQAAAAEYRSVTPTHPSQPVPPDDPAATLSELRRSVSEAPGCFRCRYWLAAVALETGGPSEALAALSPAIPRALPGEREAFEALAAAALARLGARP